MEIVRFGPDDADRLAQHVEVANAVSAADAPWQHPTTVRGAEGRFRHGWDGEVEQPYLGLVDDVPVAWGLLATSDYDNLHLAWLGLEVHPDHRRRGYGSQLLAQLEADAEAAGRTSVGVDGWESDALRGFADRHGFKEGSRSVQRRQQPTELDWAPVERLHADASVAAAAYELLRWAGPTPEAELEAATELAAAINDAPTDDLDIEDEVFPPERIRGYDEAQLARGRRIYRVVARHRDSGQLAGHTVVVVDGERPHLADQHDTSVVRAHRGHRLGLLLKADMNLWLREAEPQVTEISTWNAESNDHMISVNELLGYRPVGREIELQKSL